jgi:hypothetical protein
MWAGSSVVVDRKGADGPVVIPRPGVIRFTRAKLYQSLRRQFARPTHRNDPLAILTELQYVAVVPGSHPLCWVVNGLWERNVVQ